MDVDPPETFATPTPEPALSRTRVRAPRRVLTWPEELANGGLHIVGALLSVVALVVLVHRAGSDGVSIASAVALGLALVMLYTASSFYHLLRSPRAKHVWKVIDHASIYVLIAATWTPYCVVTLRHAGGHRLFYALWTIAAVGVLTEAAWVHRPRWLSVVVYLAMGWAGASVIGALLANLAPAGLWLLVGGGAVYTLGTVFYVMHHVRFMHAVWHLFVMLGSACHVASVAFYVFPSR